MMTPAWIRRCRRALDEGFTMFGLPEGSETVSPLPLTADGQRVPVELAGGIELGDVSIEFPETQQVAGTVNVGNFPAHPPFPASFAVSNFPAPVEFPASMAVSNFPAFPSSFAVSNFPAPPATQAVTGAFYPATQAISVATLPLPAGAATEATLALIKAKTDNLDVALSTRAVTGLTDAQLRASPVSVAGAVTATCSGTVNVGNFPATQAVTGAFFQATQPVSLAACPLPSGAATEASLSALNGKVTACNTGAVTVASSALPSGAATEGTLAKIGQASVLAVTATGVAGAAVTAVLPAAGAGQFHYIAHIRIQLYAAAARTGSATPVVVTTTNLPGSLAYTFETAQAIGTCVDRVTELGGNPLKSSAAGVLTSIVCPVATAGIWRVTVHYYVAA